MPFGFHSRASCCSSAISHMLEIVASSIDMLSRLGRCHPWDALRRLLHQSFHIMLETGLCAWPNRTIFDRKLLPHRPADNGFMHCDPILIRKRDGQRKGFPWSQKQITRESSPSTQEVPHGALVLEWSRVVCDSPVHREATIGAQHEGYRSLAREGVF